MNKVSIELIYAKILITNNINMTLLIEEIVIQVTISFTKQKSNMMYNYCWQA